jgi:hypothetical protein
MKKFIKSAAAAAVLATSATGVQAAELNTDVDVTLPSIVALYCFDSVSVNVNANGLSAALGGAPDGANTLGAASATTFSPDLDAQSQTATNAMASSVNLDLNNVCAFRALVGTSGVSVTVAENADSTMDHESVAAASIAATGVEFVAGGNTYNVTTGLGLGVAATPISVRVPLDLTNATAPGKYEQEDLFTVTVAAL